MVCCKKATMPGMPLHKALTRTGVISTSSKVHLWHLLSRQTAYGFIVYPASNYSKGYLLQIPLCEASTRSGTGEAPRRSRALIKGIKGPQVSLERP